MGAPWGELGTRVLSLVTSLTLYTRLWASLRGAIRPMLLRCGSPPLQLLDTGPLRPEPGGSKAGADFPRQEGVELEGEGREQSPLQRCRPRMACWVRPIRFCQASCILFQAARFRRLAAVGRRRVVGRMLRRFVLLTWPGCERAPQRCR